MHLNGATETGIVNGQRIVEHGIGVPIFRNDLQQSLFFGGANIGFDQVATAEIGAGDNSRSHSRKNTEQDTVFTDGLAQHYSPSPFRGVVL